MELLKIEVDTFGGSPAATHNYPCPTCRERHAVLNLNDGIMHPCWDCQAKGWTLYKARVWPWQKRKKTIR